MPEQTFHLPTVTLNLGDDLELVLSHGFPEVSSFGSQTGRASVGLRSKIKQVLENPEHLPVQAMHRRLTGQSAQLKELKVILDPPKKRADWRSPVELLLHYTTWEEAPDCHMAFVPALGIQILAAKPEQIPARVEEHVRLVVVSRAKTVLLQHLARLQLVQAVRVDEVAVTAHVKTPRQLEEEKEKPATHKSVLEQVATRLGPHRLSPAFELQSVVQAMHEVLAARRPGSILLVGPPGVGKTAVVREFARTQSCAVWSTSGGQLIAGQSGFGQWQERCRDLCREVVAAKAVLHLGHLTELMNVGQHSSNTQSIASFLRPWIARGELLTIAECTPEQLSIMERLEPHLVAAFVQVRVAEPSPAVTLRILQQVFCHTARRDSDFEASYPALDWLHRLHQRYATYSANPGRPIRFLAALLAEQGREQKTQLSVEQVTTAFTRETGLPEVLLKDELPLDLEQARQWFQQRVLGQPEAVQAVLDLLSTIKARLNRPRQPLASFLFVGPTGTGKTELAKALAEFLFGSATRLTRFDLSEHAGPAAVQRLIGSVGSTEGLLTAKVREQPFSVLLLDEFEKADASFFDLLLQILGDGRLTDGAGRVADFCNTVIIMTSNLGAREFQRGSLGFGGNGEAVAHFAEATRSFLRPEIYNRLGAILRFQPLGREMMLQVTRRHLALLRQRDGLRLRQVELVLGAGVEEYLSDLGYDPKYGARPLKRVLERELMVPLAEALNEVRHVQPMVASVTLKKQRLEIELRLRRQREEAGSAQRSWELAQEVVALRRSLTALGQCSVVMALENEMPLLGVHERRAAKHRWLSQEDKAQVDRLGLLRQVFDQLHQLNQQVNDLETSVLGAFHLSEELHANPLRQTLVALSQKRRHAQLELFRLSFSKPDEVVLAVYSEQREWLQRLITFYLELATSHEGHLVAFDFVRPPLSGSGAEAKARREPAKSSADPLSKAPSTWVGAVMHLKGPLFHPLLMIEYGMHRHLIRGVCALALVETSAGDWESYAPPAGIYRAGVIHDKMARLRRVFDEDQQRLFDSELGTTEWTQASMQELMSRTVEARLNLAVEEMV